VKKAYTSLRAVEMINPEYLNRLLALSVDHLNCSLDDNVPGYIPPDLVPGTYRWYLYMYSNMYKDDEYELLAEDKTMFLTLANKFKSEHLISWTRDRLIELDICKVSQTHQFLLDSILDTYNFYTFKVSIYMLRCLQDKWYYTDTFVIKYLPKMREFIINE
jgi:hypothetical protein